MKKNFTPFFLVFFFLFFFSEILLSNPDFFRDADGNIEISYRESKWFARIKPSETSPREQDLELIPEKESTIYLQRFPVGFSPSSLENLGHSVKQASKFYYTWEGRDEILEQISESLPFQHEYRIGQITCLKDSKKTTIEIRLFFEDGDGQHDLPDLIISEFRHHLLKKEEEKPDTRYRKYTHHRTQVGRVTQEQDWQPYPNPGEKGHEIWKIIEPHLMREPDITSGPKINNYHWEDQSELPNGFLRTLNDSPIYQPRHITFNMENRPTSPSVYKVKSWCPLESSYIYSDGSNMFLASHYQETWISEENGEISYEARLIAPTQHQLILNTDGTTWIQGSTALHILPDGIYQRMGSKKRAGNIQEVWKALDQGADQTFIIGYPLDRYWIENIEMNLSGRITEESFRDLYYHQLLPSINPILQREELDKIFRSFNSQELGTSATLLDLCHAYGLHHRHDMFDTSPLHRRLKDYLLKLERGEDEDISSDIFQDITSFEFDGKDALTKLTVKSARFLALLSLRNLSLKNNLMGNEGAKLFSEMSSLTVLNLSNNGVTLSGTQALARSKSLRKIDLSYNHINIGSWNSSQGIFWEGLKNASFTLLNKVPWALCSGYLRPFIDKVCLKTECSTTPDICIKKVEILNWYNGLRQSMSPSFLKTLYEEVYNVYKHKEDPPPSFLSVAGESIYTSLTDIHLAMISGGKMGRFSEFQKDFLKQRQITSRDPIWNELINNMWDNMWNRAWNAGNPTIICEYLDICSQKDYIFKQAANFLMSYGDVLIVIPVFLLFDQFWKKFKAEPGVQALAYNQNLTHLNISGTLTGNEGARFLALAKSSSLEHLSLAHNNIGSAGANLFMPNTTRLGFLDLKDNPIFTSGQKKLKQNLAGSRLKVEIDEDKYPPSYRRVLKEIVRSSGIKVACELIFWVTFTQNIEAAVSHFNYWHSPSYWKDDPYFNGISLTPKHVGMYETATTFMGLFMVYSIFMHLLWLI